MTVEPAKSYMDYEIKSLFVKQPKVEVLFKPYCYQWGKVPLANPFFLR